MNTETKKLLARWQSLEKNDGLQHAGRTARSLRIVSLMLCIFVVFAVEKRVHPGFVAIAATMMGWMIAESNALRTRRAQWPIFKNYIDWKKVDEDLKS